MLLTTRLKKKEVKEHITNIMPYTLLCFKTYLFLYVLPGLTLRD
jgi:hypothetical protein